MPGERFEINDVESALIGMRSGRRVGIGDSIEIKVESVEAPRGRVDLIAAEERTARKQAPAAGGGAGGRKRNRRGGSKGRR
jgi:hypothetical protein